MKIDPNLLKNVTQGASQVSFGGNNIIEKLGEKVAENGPKIIEALSKIFAR